MLSLKTTSRFALALLVGLTITACDSGITGSSGNSDTEFNLDNCTIPTGQLVDGGVGKDGIPALTNPPLVDPGTEQTDYLADTSRVIGLLVDDTPIAVPHNILWHHEIVNFDDRGGRNIAVTYCPLTGSSLAFDRAAIDGAQFGVSGLLFNNNLVMYDRRDQQSLWPQMNRQANCGAVTGTELQMIPVVEMRWSRWRTLHSNTKVVSRQTGFARNYGPFGYPYGDYEQLNNDRLLFPIDIDDRRPPKERVLGIPNGGDGGLALPFGVLDDGSPFRVIDVAVGGTSKVVFWSREGRAAMAFETSESFSIRNEQIVDDETGSVWTADGRAVDGPREGEHLDAAEEAYVAFWFAWASFQPETTIWTNSS